MTEENHINSGYEHSDAKSSKMIAIGVVSIILLTVMVLGVNEYFLEEVDAMVYNTVLSPRSAELMELQQREAETLSTYGVADSAMGTFRIPIENAMKLVVDEAQTGN